ncbi:MAG: transposon-transfer assisting family protein [Lachnospiraceae bacterium]|nr:transposon-transfer assisting family protein [Lachnospiraceae bacterium]
MNTIFTVEESNLISIFESKNRTKVMRDISNAIPHLDDEEMIDLSLRVVDKLKAMSDEEFARLEIEAAE